MSDHAPPNPTVGDTPPAAPSARRPGEDALRGGGGADDGDLGSLLLEIDAVCGSLDAPDERAAPAALSHAVEGLDAGSSPAGGPSAASTPTPRPGAGPTPGPAPGAEVPSEPMPLPARATPDASAAPATAPAAPRPEAPEPEPGPSGAAPPTPAAGAPVTTDETPLARPEAPLAAYAIADPDLSVAGDEADVAAAPPENDPGSALADVDGAIAGDAEVLLNANFDTVSDVLDDIFDGDGEPSSTGEPTDEDDAVASAGGPLPPRDASEPLPARENEPAPDLDPEPAPPPEPEPSSQDARPAPATAPVAPAPAIVVMSSASRPRWLDGAVLALQVLNLPLRLVPASARPMVDWIALSLVFWVPIVWVVALFVLRG